MYNVLNLKHDFLKKDLNLLDVAHALKQPMHHLLNNIEKPKYTTFYIPKKSGGQRQINSPANGLGNVQRRLNRKLRVLYEIMRPENVYGFTYKPKNKKDALVGIKPNAMVHVGKVHILNVDIKDFFSSISANSVRKIFLNEPFNYNLNTATAMALLTCYEGHLPAGAPSSPLLSNFYCLELDTEIISLCELQSIKYSRYADDLSFSSAYQIPNDFIDKISAILLKHKFSLNLKKIRFSSKRNAQYITGIKVNTKLNLNRKYYRQLRAIIHDVEKNGIEKATVNYMQGKKYCALEKHKFIASVSSKLNYYGFIVGKENDAFRNLIIRWEILLKESK